MNQNTPGNSIPPEWLAAYADNELDAAARCRVERWLAEHPDAVDDYQGQKQLAPGNKEYWKSVEPPTPSPEAWRRAFRAISNALPPPRAKSGHLAPILAFVSFAAAILIAILAVDRQPHDRLPLTDVQVSEDGHQGNPDVLASLAEEDPVYRVAGVDDVELIQLPEAAVSLVVVGRHPMFGVPLVLAAAGDLQLLNYGPDERGNLPDIASTFGPDPPTFWAP
jgi:hypothetical protein